MKIILLMIVLCASSAFAGSNFDLGVGGAFPQTHTDFNNEADTGIAAFLNYRYSTSKKWSFGLGLHHLDFEGTDLNDQALYFITRYDLTTHDGFRPFLIAGLGAANINPDSNSGLEDGDDSYVRGSALIGAGIDTLISDAIRIGLNLNYHHVGKFDDRTVGTEQHILVPSLSFTYSPGAKGHKATAVAAAAATTAAVTTTHQIKDSDHDGVKDSSDACPNTHAGTKVNAIGCDVKNTDFRLALNVKFLTGKAQINETSTANVDQLAQTLKENEDLKIEIQGHTDSSGSRALNMSLSAKRASAVRAYLINKHGISGDRLTAKGYGPDFPVKSNATYAGRLANRRVEAKVLSN